ncbi:MAG: 50S ribosomal protein L2 [Nanoarchaeota archaeon]
MGKRIIQQARGKGSPTYRAKSHRYKGSIKYPSYAAMQEVIEGKVERLVNCPGHSAPLALINVQGVKFYNAAALNLREGQVIQLGKNAEIKEGNVLPLAQIPDGTSVYNIEIRAGDGGKLIRTAGSSARVIKHTDGGVIILLPSKEEKTLDENARATVGTVAAAGRKEKPIVKAGKMWHMMRARNKLYPRTSAVKMNAVDHPFGSGRGKNVGKPKTPSRFAPPGRKVGLIGARRTGRRRK